MGNNPSSALSPTSQNQTMSLPDPQNSSALLSKLPLEIREEIYKHVVLGWGRSPIIHMHEKKSRFRHYRCQMEKEDVPCDGTHSGKRNTSCLMLWSEFEARDLGGLDVNPKDGWCRRATWYTSKGKNDDLLPILISCKKM